MSNVCGAAFMRDGVFPGTIIRMDRIRHMGKGYFKLPLRPGIFRRRALDLTRQLTRAGRSSLTIFAMSPLSRYGSAEERKRWAVSGQWQWGQVY
jgi:hypothetical protein